MVASSSPSSEENSILRQVDPYVFEETVNNLNVIAGGTTKKYDLPLNANSKSAADGDMGDETKRPYLETSFNAIETNTKITYRSPWVTTKNNAGEEDIREFEQSANELWDAYRQLYYGQSAVGSVYVRRKGGGVGGGDGMTSPVKTKKSSSSSNGNVLEAFFGIQNKCIDADQQEIARWDSLHCVTINALNYDQKTCNYQIESKIWCRILPMDVGDISPEEAQKVKKKKPPAAAKPKTPPKKKINTKALNQARLEMFDKAKSNWDRRHKDGKDEEAASEGKKMKIPDGPPPPPTPAVVHASAYYEKSTTKVGKFVGGGKPGVNPKIPTASHMENIGTLLEKIETDIRMKLERLDVPKTCDAIESIYNSTRRNLLSSVTTTHSAARRIHNHATGMGVGASLIAEMALKAKSKGLGGGGAGGDGGGGKDLNTAMESMLKANKKKLSDDNNNNSDKTTTTTNGWKSNLKKPSQVPPSPSPSGGTSNLKKISQAPPPSSGGTTASATPEFLKFRNKLKPSTK